MGGGGHVGRIIDHSVEYTVIEHTVGTVNWQNKLSVENHQ